MLYAIDPRFLDTVWPMVAPLLAPAVACNRGEATMDQVRAQIAFGDARLLAWEQTPGEVTGAAVIEFVQHPNMRVAHVSYIGGVGLVESAPFAELKSWCRSQGASEIRALCDESHARLFASVGLVELYRMTGAAL